MQSLEPRSIRRELLAVIALTLVGGALRFWSYGSLGLNHFDEGIYALSGLWSVTPQGLAGLDPMVIPYAPPGFPILVGLGFFLLGIADISVILASTLCGIVTIPVAGWVGRRTFGSGAGAAAAAFAAFSMPHLAFSRKGLTDVPFELTWLVAIGLGGRFLEKPRLGRAVALGIGVGLAQEFKYNGWLPGAIVALAAALGLLCHKEERRAWLSTRRLGSGPVLLSLVSAGVALVVYWPWFQFVQGHGGYQSLLTHHRSYMGGSTQWYPFWKQQQAQLVALSGGPAWGALSWSIAWLGCAWSRNGVLLIYPRNRRAGFRLAASLGLGAGLLAALASFPWWLGLAATPWLLRERRPSTRMLGSWWLLLSILTPFYHPYARLWLPLHAAGWLLLAGLLIELVPAEQEESGARPVGEAEGRPPHRARIVVALIAVVAGLGQQWGSTARPFACASFFRETSALRDTVAGLPELIRPGSGGEPKLIVLGRRPLAFYLLLQSRFPFQLAEGVDQVVGNPDAWAIIDDALFDREARLVLPAGSEARVVKTYHEVLDPVTLLDISPGAATSPEARRSVSILVLKPRGAALSLAGGPEVPAVGGGTKRPPGSDPASTSRAHRIRENSSSTDEPPSVVDQSP